MYSMIIKVSNYCWVQLNTVIITSATWAYSYCKLDYTYTTDIIQTVTVIVLKAEHHMHANLLSVQVKVLNASALTASCHHGRCDQLKVVDSEGTRHSHSCDMTDFPHKTLLVPGDSVQWQEERTGSEEIRFTLGSHMQCDWGLSKEWHHGQGYTGW